MISKYDIKQYAERNANTCVFSIDENENVIDKTDNTIVCSLETFVEGMRRETHCDFEVIYYEHTLNQITYRCKECGTVIFAREDEDYEHGLRCPVCSDYKTKFEFWAGEDIKNSVAKQRSIDAMIMMEKDKTEADKRYMKRKKYDWQIWKGTIKLPNRAIFLDLECNNLFKTKLKGLRLEIHWAHKDGASYIYKKNFRIPLSLSALKISIRIWRKTHGKTR